MRQVGEPSVEEILQSIKKVIARDNRTVAVEQRRRRDLDGLVAADRVEDEVEDADLDVLELAAEAEMSEESEMAVSQDVPEAGPLLPEEARVSMRESLAALAMLAEPGAPPQIVRSGETSLEGLTRELLRPALAEWLEKNLPPLVERMVAAEIARIVGKKG
jgi:uncharacterized protein